MKKSGAVLFIIIFLFNILGYYGLYLVVLNNLSKEFSRKVSADEYSGSDAQIVKIPVTLPYQPNFDGYQKAQGTFESNGEFYRISKYAIVNDTLLVVLVKDQKEGDLFKSVAEFVKANSNEASAKSPSKMFKNALSDFILMQNQIQSGSQGWCSESKNYIDSYLNVRDNVTQLLAPPPRA